MSSYINIVMIVAQRIKDIRLSKKLSQKEVALSIGINQAQYSRIESGKVEPTISSLDKIAQALGVNVGDFFKEDKAYDISSYDSSLIDKIKLVDELDENEKKSIFSIIDMAISKKRLTDTLSSALNFSK